MEEPSPTIDFAKFFIVSDIKASNLCTYICKHIFVLAAALGILRASVVQTTPSTFIYGEKSADQIRSCHFRYPELGAGNEWKQTSNPMALASSGVTGYQAINISSNGNYWGGLEHNNQLCLLDGSVGEGSEATWWYAIGSFGDFQGGIPGPGSEVVHQVKLTSSSYLSTARWNCMSGMRKSSRWGRSFSPVWFYR